MHEIVAGSTDQTIDVFIQDSSSTTGAGLTGLVYNTSGLTCYYRVGPTGGSNALTLANQTVGSAHTDGGFVEIDSTNQPGMYRVDLPDYVLPDEGAKTTLYFQGATNMAPLVVGLVGVADPHTVSDVTNRLTFVGVPNEVVTDSFSGSEAQDITSYSSLWKYMRGATGIRIHNETSWNELYTASPTFEWMRYNTITALEQDVSIGVYSYQQTPAGAVGIVLRANADNTLCYLVRLSSNGTIQIGVVDESKTFTAYATTTVTHVIGANTLRATISDAGLITAYWNGTSVLTFDFALSNYDGYYVGFEVNNNGGATDTTKWKLTSWSSDLLYNGLITAPKSALYPTNVTYGGTAPSGQIETVTWNSGAVWTYSYDANDNLISIAES